jgi:hypothetical protein
MTKKNEATKSQQGQEGPELQLHFSELRESEQRVVTALAQPGRPVLTIKELVEACGWKSLHASEANAEFKGKARGNSRVRNSLRRLVRSQWVENAEAKGKGTYRLTVKASARLRRLVKESASQVEEEAQPTLQ